MWLRIKTGLTLILASLFVPCACFGDPIEIATPKVPAESPNATGIDFRYQSAIKTVEFRNTSNQAIDLKTALFSVASFKVDSRPRLIYQLTPFLDLITVRITNIGWGPLDANEFHLFPAATRTSDGSFPLADLFDLHSTSTKLARIDNDTVIVFKMGEHALPFGFAYSGELDTTQMGQPPMRRGIASNRVLSSFASHLVSDVRPVGMPAKYTGCEHFEGLLQCPGKDGISAPYLARRWQLVSMNNRERRLARLLAVDLQAGLYGDWYFLFGNSIAKPVYETKINSLLGFTVDVGDGRDNSYSVEVGRTIQPHDKLELEFEFTSAKSAAFTVDLRCCYQIGAAKPVITDTKATWKCETRVPREIPLGTDDTARMLAAIREADPTIDARALGRLDAAEQLIKAATEAKVLSGLHIASNNVHPLSDAILLLSHSSRESNKTRASEVLAKVRFLADRNDGDDYENQFDGLLCKCFPAASADAAVEQYAAGNDRLLRYCESLDSSRQYLSTQSTKLRAIGEKRNQVEMGPRPRGVLSSAIHAAPAPPPIRFGVGGRSSFGRARIYRLDVLR